MVKKGKKKKLTELQRLYKKQEKRIKQIIYRERKKGNLIDITDILPPRPKRVTTQAVGRLEKLMPKEVRKKAIKAESKRARQLERAKKEVSKNTDFVTSRPSLDKIERAQIEKAKESNAVPAYLNERKIVKDALLAEINEFANIDKSLSKFLIKTLNEQIAQYGVDSVLDSIAFLPADFIETTRTVFKYGALGQTARQLIRLTQAITGTVLDADMLKRFGKIAEKLEINNWNPNEPR